MNVRLSPVVLVALALALWTSELSRAREVRRQKYSRLKVSGMKLISMAMSPPRSLRLADDFVIVEDGSTFGHIAHNADSELRVEISANRNV